MAVRVSADLVGLALCLIDLSAGPGLDVLYGLMRRRRCPGQGTPQRIFTGRGIRDAPMRAWPCIGKIPVEGSAYETATVGWAVETLCVWMWIPSRAVGIVQSRSDRFGPGLVRMAASDRVLHRHTFVRDRP